jgi:hypothetical protein
VDGALARAFLRSGKMVGCGHVSGLFVLRRWPLALMLSADQVPIVRRIDASYPDFVRLDGETRLVPLVGANLPSAETPYAAVTCRQPAKRVFEKKPSSHEVCVG